MASYLLGSTVRLTVTFTVGDVPTDPTTISLTVGDATGAPVTYTYALSQITRASAGVYWKEVVPDAAGTWVAVWTGAGDVDAVEEQSFDVVASTHPWATVTTPLAYASLSQLHAALRVDGSDELDEIELQRCLQAASRTIDGEVTRRSAGDVTGYTDTIAYPAVPAPIVEATILLAVALYKRPQAPFGVLEGTLDGSPVQLGKDFHVDALIASVVPTVWYVV
jgi:hypothetical protein